MDIKISLLDYVWVLGMALVEAGLFFIIEYRFLWTLRLMFGAMAAIDVAFCFLVSQPDFIYAQWYVIIALLIWQSFVAGQIIFLLCPKLPGSVQRIIPAIIATASVINGKPGTTWGNEYPTHHMLTYEIFCLGFLILALCFAVILSSVHRFDTVAIGFGMLLASQAVACMHRLYIGISPFVWNVCWLAGICFIVHAVFTYEPDTSLLKIAPTEGRKRT